MPKKHKILVTLGPSSMQEGVVRKMDASGVDIFRINLSHTRIEDLADVIRSIRRWTDKPICLDSEGAQVRTRRMTGGRVNIPAHGVVRITGEDVPGGAELVPLYPVRPEKVLMSGDLLYIDFDSVIIQVTEVSRKGVFARVLIGGFVGSNKGVAVDRAISMPAFTSKDIAAFRLGARMGIRHVALSFASCRNDVVALRRMFPGKISVISKIESRTGLQNLSEIAVASDAILIDRGDLSRDVPLQKIALAQRHILDVAGRLAVPVYVATNLLESMITSGKPTRAEINDVTSTILSGASGLVLAAETAIGKYPVECVRMIAGIMYQAGEYLAQKETRARPRAIPSDDLDFSLMEPHGGVLVNAVADAAMAARAAKLPRVDVSDEILSDVTQIADGVYSPLRGFMNAKELRSVLRDRRMPDGNVWTMPILFQVGSNFAVRPGGEICLTRKGSREPVAVMQVRAVEAIDLRQTARLWFGTEDPAHPGVARIMKLGDRIVSGSVHLLRRPSGSTQSHVLTPRQSRRLFTDFGWHVVVAFHTRNVIHLGHEFVQKKALARVNADALFISPVVGQKKPGDFSSDAIMDSYRVMLQNDFYLPYPAVLGAFNTYSRYSGPREAVFTALCRKNFGCTHFIVGRDHTGVGNFYAPDASQRIFAELGDIGIEPVMLDPAYYCRSCAEVTDRCAHPERARISLSATAAREALSSGKSIPRHLMRPEVGRMLQRWYRDSPKTLFV